MAVKVGAVYEELSAVSSGVAEVRRVIDGARDRRAQTGPPDGPLHRRDPSLLQVPAGRPASRRRGWDRDPHRGVYREPVFRGHPCSRSRAASSTASNLSPPTDIRTLLDRALTGPDAAAQAGAEPGGGGTAVGVPGPVLDLIADAALGDARRAFTLLERSMVLAGAKGVGVLDEATVEEAAQRKLVLYDKQADAHYDVISAFIKSLRGSDPDAASVLPGGHAHRR